MAIEKLQSSVFGAIAALGYVGADGASANGRINRVAGTVANAVDASQGSEYHLCSVPASAILLPESAIKTTGWGFAQAVIGVAGATDALLDVAKATGGATGNKPITIFGANWNKQIWEQLGLAEDPGEMIDLVVFTEGDATIAGQIDFDLVFANHV